MKKKMLALALASAMVVSMLGACGNNNQTTQDSSGAQTQETSGSQSQDSSQEDVLLESNNEELTSSEVESTNYVFPELKMDIGQFNINPMAQRGAGQVTYSVYEMLYATESGIGSAMIPWLADANKGGNNSLGLKGMDHEDGSTEYTFYIYDYITDSAGHKITASDVVFSFEQTRDYGQVSGWGSIEGWEAVDDTTVKMTTSRELNQKGEIENILLRCYIFSEEAFNASASGFTTDACGTGPYVIAPNGFEQDAYITCEARDDYWQTNEELRPRCAQANVAKFTANAISDDNTKVTAIQSGDIDLISTLATTAAGPFIGNDQFQVYNYPANGIHYLSLNCSSDSIMADPNMRLAVYYAISNENLANILNAAGVQAYYPITAFGHALFSDYLTKWDSETTYVTEFSLEKSKEYQELAGYNGETLYFLNANDTTGIVENLQNMLVEAGFKVELKSYDRNTINSYLGNSAEWDLYYNMTNSSDYTTSLWSHVMDPASFNGHTENFIDDAHYNELLSTALTVGSTDADLDAYWQYTVENAYFYPLVRNTQSMILPQSVANVWLSDKNLFIPGAAYYKEQ